MSSHVMQTPSPTSVETADQIKGALAVLALKGKQQTFTHLLLAASTKTPPTVLESIILAKFYGENGADKINHTHNNRLRSLAVTTNKRLKKLSLKDLAVSCVPLGADENKSWHLQIKEPDKVSSGFEAETTKTVFITTDKPEFSWCGSGAVNRTREIWLPVHGEDVRVTHRVEDEWKPPSGFSKYADFRKACWEDYQKVFRNSPNPRVWHVAACLPKSDQYGNSCHGVELMVKPIDYKDIVATTFQLKTEIEGDSGKTTIYDWLLSGREDRKAACHFVPAGNPLLVEVNLITNDGKLIVRQHYDKKKNETRWESAVFGYMDSVADVYRNALHIPDPSETFFRKCCQLLRLPVQPARVRWLGVGFGLMEGKVSLMGEVEIRLTAAELLSYISNHQKLQALEMTPKAIHKFCYENKIRAHAEALLVLSLKRRQPKVKIVTTVPKRKEKQA